MVCVCVSVRSRGFAHSAGWGAAAGRSSPESWRSPPGRCTGPRPGGRRWAAAAPACRQCPASRDGRRGTVTCAAASASGRAARTPPAPTRTRWSRGTKPGCCRGGGRPCSAGPRCPPPGVCWMERHSPPGLLQDSSQVKSSGTGAKFTLLMLIHNNVMLLVCQWTPH